MSIAAQSWVEDAFFEEPEQLAIDGGSTTHGALWHAISPRWGHSMHTMCSYHGMFPPKLAHYFIQRFSRPGDVVLDPFGGRGTTTLQARVEGRRSIGNDLSPLAYVLGRAKASPPTWSALNRAVDALEKAYKVQAMQHIDVHPDVAMLYHPNTLKQLVYLRAQLFRRGMSKWSQADFMIAGAMAGILHGAHRSDGTSQYLSISMPNTFSMAPGYVEKFIRENGLEQLDQNVFDCLRDKLARLYLDDVAGPTGTVTNKDAASLLGSSAIKASSVDLLLTSPPYLDVVNYGTSNWIRLWWLGLDEVARDAGKGRRKLNARLDHRHTYASYVEFMKRTLIGTRRALRKSGVAVFVIGDVAAPGGPSRPVAEEVWDEVGDATGLKLLEVIEDSIDSQIKVSRIWGETKGKATNRDCVLVLNRADGEPGTNNTEVEWLESYKDGGPDEAHERLRHLRRKV